MPKALALAGIANKATTANAKAHRIGSARFVPTELDERELVKERGPVFKMTPPGCGHLLGACTACQLCDCVVTSDSP
jgi:hypothetical protein